MTHKKKYYFKGSYFEVDIDLKEEHLDAINSNPFIEVMDTNAGGKDINIQSRGEDPAYIMFRTYINEDLCKILTNIPNTRCISNFYKKRIERDEWFNYKIQSKNGDYKKWWEDASQVVAKIGYPTTKKIKMEEVLPKSLSYIPSPEVKSIPEIISIPQIPVHRVEYRYHEPEIQTHEYKGETYIIDYELIRVIRRNNLLPDLPFNQKWLELPPELKRERTGHDIGTALRTLVDGFHEYSWDELMHDYGIPQSYVLAWQAIPESQVLIAGQRRI
jgi:hypothetical protein